MLLGVGNRKDGLCRGRKRLRMIIGLSIEPSSFLSVLLTKKASQGEIAFIKNLFVFCTHSEERKKNVEGWKEKSDMGKKKNGRR